MRQLAGAARLHIVVIAFLGTLTYGWFFSGRHLWLLALTAALDWLLLDLGNKVSDLPEDLVNNPVEAAWVRDHRGALMAAVLVALALSLVHTALSMPRLLLPRLVFQAGGVLYNFRVLPGGLRLKQIYAVKNASAACLFLITLVGYPLIGHGLRPPIAYVAALAAFFLFFEMSFEVVYDFKDLEGDRREGVPTYPARHGERAARLIFDAFVLGAAAALLAGYLAGVLRFRELLMVLGPAVQAALFEPYARRGYRASDTVLITHAGSLQLLVYNGWVLLGLPIPP